MTFYEQLGTSITAPDTERAEHWDSQAACRGSAERGLDFTANVMSGAQKQAAIAICRQCPVIAECAKLANELPSVSGVWAGRHRSVTGPAPRDERKWGRPKKGTRMPTEDRRAEIAKIADTFDYQAELAYHFNVSDTTIARDIRILRDRGRACPQIQAREGRQVCRK